MDTAFWGPSGWRLLHLTAFKAPTLPQKELHTFFETLPYVLPCKFCRASLTDYYVADPIPTKASEYAHWLYRIHNRVNGKLREQKLLEAQNPSWTEVKQNYAKLIKNPPKTMVGWDFLYSVAYTTPCKEVTSTPIHGAPPKHSMRTPELQNRWNSMSIEDRIPKLKIWWDTLPHILPFPEWSEAWEKVVPPVPHLSCGRKKVAEWLYIAEKAICQYLHEKLRHDSFDGLCKELHTFSSGCSKIKSPKIKTCRVKKTIKRKQLIHSRTRKYKMTGGFL